MHATAGAAAAGGRQRQQQQQQHTNIQEPQSQAEVLLLRKKLSHYRGWAGVALREQVFEHTRRQSRGGFVNCLS